MATVFFTGFPGFLGSELLPRVLERRTGDRAVCLVQAKFAHLAELRVAELVEQDPDITLCALRDALAAAHGVCVHHSTIGYALDRPGYTFRKRASSRM